MEQLCGVSKGLVLEYEDKQIRTTSLHTFKSKFGFTSVKLYPLLVTEAIWHCLDFVVKAGQPPKLVVWVMLVVSFW